MNETITPLDEKKHNPKECNVCKLDTFTEVLFYSDVKEALKNFKEELKFEMCEKESFISFSETAFNRDIIPILLKHFGRGLL